jgi:hypothetical protein
MIMESPHNVGTQPLDQIMSDQGLSNHVIVAASTEFLTHKVVQKARKGRRLTRRTQDKIVRALNAVSPGGVFTRGQIFNYDGS